MSVDLLKRLFAKREAPLRGVPAVRRQKNYSAESGYAYEYFYDGWRESGRLREYVFTVSGNRKTWFPLSVFAAEDALRALAENERYAVAKLALFAAFDQRESPAAMTECVRVTTGQVAELLARLGIE